MGGPVVVVPVTQQQYRQPQWMISPSCSIQNNGSGILMDGCLKDSALQPVPLSDASFREMTQMNESIVVQGDIQHSNSNNNNNKGGNSSSSIYQGGKKGKKRNRNDEYSKQKRQKQWNDFKHFLQLQQNNLAPSSTTTSTVSTSTVSSSSSVPKNDRDRRPY